jgi:2Fe-2S ferredoxin
MAVVKIKITDELGEQSCIDATVGESLMVAATNNLIAGLDAECGGFCSCGTCEVMVGGAWSKHLPEMKTEEIDMLSFTSKGQEGCRLSCQICITPEMDGMEVKVVK